MRGLLAIGIGTLLIGFILCSILASLFSSGAPEIGSSYLGFIGFSILYLASVIAVCTYMIINNKSFFKSKNLKSSCRLKGRFSN